MMKVRPLHPHAALLAEEGADAADGSGNGNGNKRYVVVSDLHVGLEGELGARGITVRPGLAGEMAAELSALAASQKAALVLLGDVKSTVGEISRQEWDDIPALFARLAAQTDVYLVPGNHDGNIRHLLPETVNVAAGRGMVIGDTLFVHGHTMPSAVRSGVRRIVMGHLHPVFFKKGSVLAGERVWIYLQVKKEALFAAGEGGVLDIIVVPSFNRYLYAGERMRKKSTSPIMARVIEKGAILKCMVATLDGSIVGDEQSALNDVL
ncbi:metallophosphoesterase [Nitrososphaera sp.]|uniref:metallophosphoesterase n=1 Tax=Nitrososphaera sp. TaxID=1971748 RepID=UPI00307F5A69